MMPIRNRRRRGFLSTPSARRATRPAGPVPAKRSKFLSTPSARRATCALQRVVGKVKNFYPRPPRGGRRVLSMTPTSSRYFYPRPPRGGRHDSCRCPAGRKPISIHALREEGDRVTLCSAVSILISIHALREEGDRFSMERWIPIRNFYPRPPRGGRLHTYERFIARCTDFYPRPPRGGRHDSFTPELVYETISIHALREEGDVCWLYIRFVSKNFYPRPPRGGRPAMNASVKAIELFLSTPSARRATAKTETKSLFSYKLYNILHEFRRALIYNGSKSYPNHAK